MAYGVLDENSGSGAFARLTEQFRGLPGIGRKTAARLALAMIEQPREKADAFVAAIIDARDNIRHCQVCGNLCESDVCAVCSDVERDRTTVCVVEDIRARSAFEKVREYRGLYHVLGGALSPMDGIGPEQLNIASLLERVKDGVKEVIVATNPTIEGETTAMYLTRVLLPLGVKVSRLAYGVPVGGDLEYADRDTLGHALEGRRTIEE